MFDNRLIIIWCDWQLLLGEKIAQESPVIDSSLQPVAVLVRVGLNFTRIVSQEDLGNKKTVHQIFAKIFDGMAQV